MCRSARPHLVLGEEIFPMQWEISFNPFKNRICWTEYGRVDVAPQSEEGYQTLTEKKYQQALFIKFIVEFRMDIEESSIQLKNLHEDQLLSFAIIVLPLIAIVILLGCFCLLTCLCARARGSGGFAIAELGTRTSKIPSEMEVAPRYNCFSCHCC